MGQDKLPRDLTSQRPNFPATNLGRPILHDHFSPRPSFRQRFPQAKSCQRNDKNFILPPQMHYLRSQLQAFINKQLKPAAGISSYATIAGEKKPKPTKYSQTMLNLPYYLQSRTPLCKMENCNHSDDSTKSYGAVRK